MTDAQHRAWLAGRVRRAAALACALLAFIAASCDSEVQPPPAAAWTLGECVAAPGVAALLIGRDAIGCVSEAGTFEAVLPGLRFPGGKYYLHGSGTRVVIALRDLALNNASYRLDLTTGRFDRLSPGQPTSSQIARVGYTGDRYLITDYFDSVRSDTARFDFSFVDGDRVTTTLSLSIPDIGFVSFNDGAYHEPSNLSAHVFVASLESGETGRYEMVVDHAQGTYRFLNAGESRLAGARFLRTGELVVVDNVFERLYLARGALDVVRDVDGKPLRSAPSELAQDRNGDVYTYTREDTGTRVLRLLPSGTVEEVFRLDRPQRAIYASPSADVLCLREHRPFGYEEETFDDTITVYSLADGSVETYPTTLPTAIYEAPRIACL